MSTNVLSIPPELKVIIPFVRRAEELDKDAANAAGTGRPESRLVAYYCRQHAVRKGIPLIGPPSATLSPAAAAAAKTCLGQLLQALEQEKPAMDQFTRPEAEYVCRQFAYRIFDKADAEDRQGMANKNTAKTFYTAASFLQMLEQFYDDHVTANTNDDDLEEKEEPHQQEKAEDKKRALYAKWKATEILKAIKEGRVPQAGGYGEGGEQPDQDDDQPPSRPNGNIPEPMNIDSITPTAHNPPPHFQEHHHPHPHDEAEDNEEEPPTHLMPPTLPPPVWPAQSPSPPKVESVFRDEDDDDEEEEGTEVVMSPDGGSVLPPSYPGSSTRTSSTPSPSTTTFPTPPTTKPSPSLSSSAPNSIPKASSGGGLGWFGGGGGGNKRPSSSSSQKVTHKKALLNDAAELTRFALAALEDKQPELAAERLQQALNVLYSSS